MRTYILVGRWFLHNYKQLKRCSTCTSQASYIYLVRRSLNLLSIFSLNCNCRTLLTNLCYLWSKSSICPSVIHFYIPLLSSLQVEFEPINPVQTRYCSPDNLFITFGLTVVTFANCWINNYNNSYIMFDYKLYTRIMKLPPSLSEFIAYRVYI
jgi:hypothetical protein